MKDIYKRSKDWKIEDYFTVSEIARAQNSLDKMHQIQKTIKESKERIALINPAEIIFNNYLTQIIYQMNQSTDLEKFMQDSMLVELWNKVEWESIIKDAYILLCKEQNINYSFICLKITGYYGITKDEKNAMFIDSLSESEKKNIHSADYISKSKIGLKGLVNSNKI